MVYDCVRHALELCSSREEAVNAWRGAHVEVAESWVHHCGTGITISHSFSPGEAKRLPWQRPTCVLLTENKFEDLISQSWSSAVSVQVSNGSEDLNTQARFSDVSAQIAHPAMSVFWPVDARFVNNRVARCSAGVRIFGGSLHCEGNRLESLTLSGFQLRAISNVTLLGNHVDGCGRAAVTISAARTMSAPARCVLRRNSFSNSAHGLRAFSNEACILELSDDRFLSNVEGVSISGPGYAATIDNCSIRGNRRAALRVGSSAHATVSFSHFAGNGRGVAVTDGSAEIRDCIFEDNVGWAVRLEGPADGSAPTPGARVTSVVRGNVFGPAVVGNVGRKRVRVDDWHEGVASVTENVEAGAEGEAGGAVVEPFRKRRR